jgi:hypothetical protein
MASMHQGWLPGWLVVFRDFTVPPLPAFPNRFQWLVLILVPFGPVPYPRPFADIPPRAAEWLWTWSSGEECLHLERSVRVCSGQENRGNAREIVADCSRHIIFAPSPER